MGYPDHVAAEARLGNVAMIWYLHERIAKLLPVDSLLLQKVLYSASHTGDELAASLMPVLQSELRLVAQDQDADVRRFCETMTNLTSAALREGTAITF